MDVDAVKPHFTAELVRGGSVIVKGRHDREPLCSTKVSGHLSELLEDWLGQIVNNAHMPSPCAIWAELPKQPCKFRTRPCRVVPHGICVRQQFQKLGRVVQRLSRNPCVEMLHTFQIRSPATERQIPRTDEEMCFRR